MQDCIFQILTEKVRVFGPLLGRVCRSYTEVKRILLLKIFCELYAYYGKFSTILQKLS